MQLLTYPTPVREITLEELWREAETLGHVYVYTSTNWGDTQRMGYDVKIKGRIGNAKIEIERRNTSLLGAFSDAINEARNLGMGW